MASLIKVKECSYSIKGINVFDRVDLSIEVGKVNVLLGDNGLGKSILMDLIGGIIKPSSGNVLYSISENDIGYVSQHLGLPYLLKVKEAIVYLAILINSDFSRKKFEQIYDIMNPKVKNIINKCKDKRASKCSYGEAKLILINLFIACGKKKLIILDEPTSGLSPVNRLVFLELINKALNQGVTILYSTHILEDLNDDDFVIDLNSKVVQDYSLKNIEACSN